MSKYSVGDEVGKYEILQISKNPQKFKIFCKNCEEINWIPHKHLKRDSERKCNVGRPKR